MPSGRSFRMAPVLMQHGVGTVKGAACRRFLSHSGNNLRGHVLGALAGTIAACAAVALTQPDFADAERKVPLPKVTLTTQLTIPGSPQAEQRVDEGLMPPPAPPFVDSNSPSYWSGSTFVQIHSAGVPVVSIGSSAESFTSTRRANFTSATSVDPQLIDTDITVGPRRIRGGFWIESLYEAGGGFLYGFYHFESTTALCPETDLRTPFIGAAVSQDGGRSWRDLGLIMSAPPNTVQCSSPNEYFAGGVGDFTVLAKGDHLYFHFSSYSGTPGEQGVAVARLPIESLSSPSGHVEKWNDGSFSEPGLGGTATATFPAESSWNSAEPDAFWGPSVHWNTYLRRYVMLLNRAIDPEWTQEGIYVSFNRDITDPEGWSKPKKLLAPEAFGGAFYPQVIGTDLPGEGTDRRAGRTPRLFVHGVSEHVLRFRRPK